LAGAIAGTPITAFGGGAGLTIVRKTPAQVTIVAIPTLASIENTIIALAIETKRTSIIEIITRKVGFVCSRFAGGEEKHRHTQQNNRSPSTSHSSFLFLSSTFHSLSMFSVPSRRRSKIN